MKRYPKAGREKVYIRAKHPTNAVCCDLLSKKITDLKTILNRENIECEDQTRKAVIRTAIWNYFADNLNLEEKEIDVTKEDGKTIWESLKKFLPVYSLFQADRSNNDHDKEIQDPLKEAVKSILKEENVAQMCQQIAEHVTTKLQEVSNHTLDKIREMNPELANSLSPNIPSFTDLKWSDLFKNVSIAGDNDIPINKRGSGVKRLILLNFFRAEAERMQSNTESDGLIYAIEEPETSQHVAHQKILMKAFEEVKPNLIITVPLVIEKIYKNVIQPIINKKTMKWALSIPLLDGQIYGQIRKKLIDALGGRFKEVIIGGAAMNPEVEEFFHRIKFPFTIGYGMTECAPLISYAPWNEFVPTSSGRVLDIMEARICKENPDDKLGEIQVRGENVMTGYYKNPEATKEVFTEDGWLRTGDLGTLDDDNNLYIRGRSKTMILSSSGQNIFPEEIEARLNNMPFVLESLVIERNKRLVALVYADYEALDSLGLNQPDNLKTIMDENLKNLNNSVAAYEKVSQIQLYPTEFEKTPKRSIKRYLYNSIAED